ncbi:hypothetical protein PsAD2_01192 [Pseudovibrio axinellae]|uniref:Uncharacterized protein n=1 Tax=Pseudovibrio axinellae TaxID=989403 RepID=A0A166A7T4_9HYPH|nr:hypothetical protein PsAD2_01192 [Pseudovibrio axinellae]SER25209.1 hypothetical protein SAMN05421798_107185 [Pseudovibrio axinellae]
MLTHGALEYSQMGITLEIVFHKPTAPFTQRELREMLTR